MSTKTKEAPTLEAMLVRIRDSAIEMNELLGDPGNDKYVDEIMADPAKLQVFARFQSICIPEVLREACEIALDEMTGDRVGRAMSTLIEVAEAHNGRVEGMCANDVDDDYYRVTVTLVSKAEAQEYIERAKQLSAVNESLVTNTFPPTRH